MYAGIVIDTNNFTNQAGVRTFEAAAYLRRSGADITRVRKLFRDDMAEYKVKAKAVDKAEVFEGAFAISECQGEGIENPTIIAAQTANELLGIKGIKASVVLTEYQGVIYLSARSIDEGQCPGNDGKIRWRRPPGHCRSPASWRDDGRGETTLKSRDYGNDRKGRGQLRRNPEKQEEIPWKLYY